MALLDALHDTFDPVSHHQGHGSFRRNDRCVFREGSCAETKRHERGARAVPKQPRLQKRRDKTANAAMVIKYIVVTSHVTSWATIFAAQFGCTNLSMTQCCRQCTVARAREPREELLVRSRLICKVVAVSSLFPLLCFFESPLSSCVCRAEHIPLVVPNATSFCG